jgi:hypothetical protein
MTDFHVNLLGQLNQCRFQNPDYHEPLAVTGYPYGPTIEIGLHFNDMPASSACDNNPSAHGTKNATLGRSQAWFNSYPRATKECIRDNKLCFTSTLLISKLFLTPNIEIFWPESAASAASRAGLFI